MVKSLVMQEAFKIWIDRLEEGKMQKIQESFDPSFLEINEKELQFLHPVAVVGEAYLTKEHLVIHLKASTKATIPCVVCNEMVDVELKADNFYHSEELSGIQGALFSYQAPLREALLIELPHYFECCNGKCPERSGIAPYLRPPTLKGGNDEHHFPFSNL